MLGACRISFSGCADGRKAYGSVEYRGTGGAGFNMNCLSGENLKSLFGVLAETHTVLVPVRTGERLTYQRWPVNGREIVLGEVRSIEPLKAFFFKAREHVAEGFDSQAPPEPDKPLCIVGAKACDLQGFVIADSVFAPEEDPDPFYRRIREKALIISCDCTFALDTCFCVALGLKPHPESRFDLNLSPINGGYLVEVGSEKGQAVLDQHAQFFSTGEDRQLEEREALRDRVRQAVAENLRTHDIPSCEHYAGMVERGYDSEIWADEAKTCVECGACNTICPTCHCFFLSDQKAGSRHPRFRMWDSCMVKDFARVAGGGNPRSHLWMRLRNRFEKKFDFFPKVSGTYACTGCGRCVSACPAKIDIRRVLNRLVNHG